MIFQIANMLHMYLCTATLTNKCLNSKLEKLDKFYKLDQAYSSSTICDLGKLELDEFWNTQTTLLLALDECSNLKIWKLDSIKFSIWDHDQTWTTQAVILIQICKLQNYFYVLCH